MSRLIGRPTIRFCPDEALGYERSRTQFVSGEGLVLDDAYRLAHLPLVAPEHPSVIRMRTGSPYEMGRHDRVFSLALPVSADALLSSSAFQEMERELKAACFAPKIAWSLMQRRKDKLHATVCGSLAVGNPPTIGDRVRRELAKLGPLHIELRGLFSGNVNVGRLYLRVYPEERKGANVCKVIQRVLNRPMTDLYLIGMFNFIDNLDAVEASALNVLLQRWWDRPLLWFEADHLWLLGASDDLLLDGAVVETIPLK
ncbi:MAG: hypothetical protein GY788_30695 [bacterium]|nr:hypothetical protein [bacterium]